MAEMSTQQNETKEGTGPFTSGAQQRHAALNPVVALSESRESDPLRVASNAQGRTETASLVTGHSIASTSTLLNLSETPDSLDITLGESRLPVFGQPPPLGPKTFNSVKANSTEASTKHIKMSWDSDRRHQERFFDGEDNASNSNAQNTRLEEVRIAPLFAADVLRVSADAAVSTVPFNTLPQYGLLAKIKDVCGRDPETPQYAYDENNDNRLFLNTDSPWYAFICGSQRSGKSHTLSCMLEGAMLQSQAPYILGKLQHPLASIVFHYDNSNQLCEAAYLCSTGIPVNVLVSPVSFGKLRRLYSNLPNVPRHLRPIVRPLEFGQHRQSTMCGLFHRRAAIWEVDKWSSKPGSLTIVDLSCPSVDKETACELFRKCLSIFVHDRNLGGRIVALDKAHEFINEAESAPSTFTQSLLSVIRERHDLATRVIIATQELTLSPKLLELSNITIIHHFDSSSGLQPLKTLLAGVSVSDDREARDPNKTIRKILKLGIGEALLFSPSMLLSISEGRTPTGARILQAEKLEMGYIKMRVRGRVGANGGRNLLAA